MPSIITDDMVKAMCFTSRPIPVQAIGVLDPNRKIGYKPNFIRKRGRSGIKPVQLPIYAPASVGGLVHSICEITKLKPLVVENYLENAIDQELGEYTGNQEEIEVRYDADQEPMYAADYADFEAKYAEFQEGSSSETPIELFDIQAQTRASGLQETKPFRKGKLEEGAVLSVNPSRFVSAGATEGETGIGTGELDVNNPRAVQGGVVGRPRLRGSESRRADGEPEL